MRAVRWAVAILVGAAVATAVTVWPPRPVWATAAADDDLLRFAADGREVVTASRVVVMAADEPTIQHRLRRRATATGAVVGDVPVAVPDRWLDVSFGLSPDGELVVASGAVMEVVVFGRSSIVIPNHVPPAVFDTRTGRRLWAAPTAGGLLVSPCGRWVSHLTAGEPVVLTVFARVSGIPVWCAGLGSTHDAGPRFSPEGDHLAILTGTWAQPRAIKLLRAATGEPIHQFPLPAERAWSAIQSWDDRGLFVVAETKRDGTRPGRRTFAFDWRDAAPTGVPVPTRDAPASATSLPRCDIDRGWVAHTTDAPVVATVLHRVTDRARTLVGLPILKRPDEVHHIAIFDEAGGRQTGRLANLGGRFVIAPDGRHVAHLGDGRLELWDARPWPRWPLDAAAGVAPLALAWVVGRRTRRAAYWHGLNHDMGHSGVVVR